MMTRKGNDIDEELQKGKKRDILKNKMHLDDTKIEIEIAHRIGKPDANRHKQRPTIVKLLRFKDCEDIIQNVCLAELLFASFLDT